MCLEGMLTSAIVNLPGGKFVGPFISIIILCIALFFAFKAQSIGHFVFACYCPILYIIYYFAIGTKNKDKNTETST